jgi:site-specific DNA-cytosine methylase
MVSGLAGRMTIKHKQDTYLSTYCPDKAATLTAGVARKPGVNPPGRRQEDDINLVVYPVALRGREDGAELEWGEPGEPGEPAYSLRTGSGGSSKPMVCVTGDKTHTLTSEGADASEDGTGRATPLASDGDGVRRLTPLECERLQGFPDGHTDGQSDAQRYRQCGNAVAVPVVQWIAERLVHVDGREDSSVQLP